MKAKEELTLRAEIFRIELPPLLIIVITIITTRHIPPEHCDAHHPFGLLCLLGLRGAACAAAVASPSSSLSSPPASSFIMVLLNEQKKEEKDSKKDETKDEAKQGDDKKTEDEKKKEPKTEKEMVHPAPSLTPHTSPRCPSSADCSAFRVLCPVRRGQEAEREPRAAGDGDH